jgi:hypothetical protein
MLTADQIRIEIVKLAEPYVRSFGQGAPSEDRNALDGLVWALLGERPKHVDISKMELLYEILKKCGIPCTLAEGAYHAIHWDEQWMKDRDLPMT